METFTGVRHGLEIMLMFANPEWFIDFDHNPQVAIAALKKILAEIAATRERIYGFTSPGPASAW